MPDNKVHHLIAADFVLGSAPKRQRSKAKPTLVSVAKQASKAAIEVKAYEVRPDGTVVIIVGSPDIESVAGRIGDQAVTRKLPKFVQAWVDHEGRPHHYLRRAGYARVRLNGLPWSAQFMADYAAAMETPLLPIGSKRSKPGSVNVAVVGYYSSLEFRSLAAGTQKKRRAILERFRKQHGDKPIAMLPQKFIAVMLSTMKPFAARNWLKTIRHLMQFCVTQELCEIDPTQGIKLRRPHLERSRDCAIRGGVSGRHYGPARARAWP